MLSRLEAEVAASAAEHGLTQDSAPMPDSSNPSTGQEHGQSADRRNASLDGLRGVAVILTFLVHYCGSYMALFRGANPNVVPFAGWADGFDKVMYLLFRSHYGVYIFFMLSGYLIAKIALGRNFAYLPFVRNRVLRIYPAFLLALVACIALGFAARLPLPSGRDLVLNLFFLNGFPPAHVGGIIFNNVTWSLFYEMVFYLVFPTVLMLARYFRSPAPLAIALAGALISYGPFLFGFYSELFLLLFVGAMAGAVPSVTLGSTARSIPDIIIVGLYFLITGLMSLGYLTNSQFVWLFAGLGFLLIAKAVIGEGPLARSLAWAPLAGLGRISYSFYLLHSISITIVLRIRSHFGIPRLGPEFDALWLGLLSFAGAIVLGWASFMVAERFYFERRRAYDPLGDAAVRDIP